MLQQTRPRTCFWYRAFLIKPPIMTALSSRAKRSQATRRGWAARSVSLAIHTSTKAHLCWKVLTSMRSFWGILKVAQCNVCSLVASLHFCWWIEEVYWETGSIWIARYRRPWTPRRFSNTISVRAVTTNCFAHQFLVLPYVKRLLWKFGLFPDRTVRASSTRISAWISL